MKLHSFLKAKNLLVIAGVVLLAASCSRQEPTPQPTVSIQYISIDPSYKSGDFIMYADGAVVKVMATNAVSVDIRYHPHENPTAELSLGQATSLSSQQNAWAFPLPKDIWAQGLWAEAKDSSGQSVQSQDLGNVRYETLNSYTSPTSTGFSINYNGDFGFSTDLKQVQTTSYIPVCDENMAACAYLLKDAYNGTNFEAAGVSININPALNTQTKCYNFAVATNEAQTPGQDATINGVAFKTATGGGGAAGHLSKITVYRNFHNNKCYEIAQHVTETNIGNYEPGTVTQFNEDEVWQKLQGVADSFRFTN